MVAEWTSPSSSAPSCRREDLVAHVRAAEAAGFAEAWLWEDCFKGGGIAQAATALAATERITVGLGIHARARARTPHFTAMETALLARLHARARLHPGSATASRTGCARSARGRSRR